MIRKILSLSLVAVILSVTALAAPGAVTLNAVYAADEDYAFTAPGSAITAVTEKATVGQETILNATHSATLPEAWDGTAATSIDTDENGTYLISNGAELAYFATVVAENNAANAKLDADINLAKANGELNPFYSYMIGGEGTSSTQVAAYAGTFDGQGHTIYNYYSGNAAKFYRTALFRYVSGGTIKNLNMVDAKVINTTGGTSASHPHGVLADQLGNGATVSNVYISGEAIVNTAITDPSKDYYNLQRVHRFGAIAGQSDLATIRDCYSDLNIDFSMQPSTVAVVNCPAASAITYKTSVGIGGIVGMASGSSAAGGTTIINCGNGGTINAPKHRAVGGIVGHVSNAASSTYNCYNTGDITGYGYVAGIIGKGRSGAQVNFRGIIGDPYRAGNGYNTGTITAVATEDPYAAGIMSDGRRQNVSHSRTDVFTIYSTGEVRMSSEADNTTNALLLTVNSLSANDGLTGGLEFYNVEYAADTPVFYGPVGVKNDAGTPDDESDDTTTYEKRPINAGTGYTLAEFKTQDAVDAMNGVSGANFTMDIGINDGLPIMETQLDELVTSDAQYQIGSYTDISDRAREYTLSAKLEEAGYISLDVIPFGAEEVVIKAYKADGTTELDSVTVSKAGIISLATGEETDVVIKATTGRALINLDITGVQTGGEAITELSGSLIKVTLQHAETATVVVALYAADDTLKAVKYAPATASVEGEVSVIIDLNGIDTEGCTLRAFAWADGTLVPSGIEEILN